MKSEQPAAQERPVLVNPTDNKLDESVSRGVAGFNGDIGRPVNPDDSSVITGELLKLIGKLTEEKSKPSETQRFLTHPLVIVVVSFLLSVPLGGFLTYIYTRKQTELENRRDIQQQELVRQRSFSDELNRCSDKV